MLPIGLQVYSIRDDADADFRKAMQNVKEMGYEGVELAGRYGITLPEIKEILDETGLTLVSAHIPVDELEKEEVLEEYAAIGLKYPVIPWMKVEATEESLEECLAQIKKIAERCKAHGMHLMYHNHDFEFEKVNGEHILDTYYSEISPELLKPELDTCWVNVGGEVPAEYVTKYASRQEVVHLKDFVGGKTDNMYELIGDDEAVAEKQEDAFELRPVGYGVQNVPEIIAAAEAAGVKWLIVEQDMPSMDKTPMECVKMSIDYLKTL